MPPGDAGALADALVQVLSDRHLAQRLGATARVVGRALARFTGGVRTRGARVRREGLRLVDRRRWSHEWPAYTPPMRADRAKQLLKNGVYRALGETWPAPAASTAKPNGRCACSCTTRSTTSGRTRRRSPPRSSPSRCRFSGRSAISPSRSSRCATHYVEGAPLPTGAVLITFDDGYRDNLLNAVPVLRRHGYPAVIFVPIGFLDGAGRCPTRSRSARSGSVTRRSTGTSSRTSKPQASASSRTASGTGP